MKWKNIIALALLILLVAAGFTGYQMYNKPHRSASDEKGTIVTAAQLCGDYEADEMGSDKKYIGQVLEVSGTISEITKNQENSTVVILAGSSMCTVQCTFLNQEKEFQKGANVVIKGFCNGYLLTEVKLDRCVLKL